jgi:hypothetical protein
MVWLKGKTPTTKVHVVVKNKQSEITLDEFKSLPEKYSLNAINKFSDIVPIRLCHLLMVSAWWLFFYDAFGKVLA